MSSGSDAVVAADSGGGQVGDPGEDDGKAKFMFNVKQMQSVICNTTMYHLSEVNVDNVRLWFFSCEKDIGGGQSSLSDTGPRRQAGFLRCQRGSVQGSVREAKEKG